MDGAIYLRKRRALVCFENILQLHPFKGIKQERTQGHVEIVAKPLANLACNIATSKAKTEYRSWSCAPSSGYCSLTYMVNTFERVGSAGRVRIYYLVKERKPFGFW